MSGTMGFTNTSMDLVFTDTVDGETVEQIYNLGDMAWIIVATALVWLMIPGLGLFYSGLLRRKNALSMIFLSIVGIAITSFQFYFWGFSLAFSDTATNGFIGNLDYFALKGVFSQPSGAVPYLLFMIFQCMFACITGVIAIGGFAERSTIGPIMVFLFIWVTIVYCPIACAQWNANGWLANLGSLDYAGGTPVHISSGTAALAIALYLGKRRGYGTEALAYRPNNTANIIIGTAFLWVGWFGFNGGSGLGANLRAVQAIIVTNLAASVGGVTWMCLDWRLERKWSAVGFCSGAISGLVGITPASGYVDAWAAVVIGFVTAVGCNFATKLKYLIRVDEALDVFASHAIGGLIGGCLTGLFASPVVAAFDGSDPINGGWIAQHYVQLGYQLAEGIFGMAWSFTITTLILWIMHFIPGLRLRCSEEAEIVGVDDFFMGEFVADYVSADPEMRMQRIDSKLHPVSGDVLRVPETPSGSASSTNGDVPASKIERSGGGGRHDE